MAQNHQVSSEQDNKENEPWKQAFAPIVGTEPEVMILGSLPGDASLVANQYYAHPRNQFWRLLGDSCGVALQDLPYAVKLACLQQLPIIVWDVVDKAQRMGSLDSAIKAAQVRDLAQLLEQYPSVTQVWFNGKQAAKLGQVGLQDAGVKQIVLPSSSPAYTLAYAHKLVQWQAAWQGLSASCNKSTQGGQDG